jgi:hypothetical protein
MASADTPGRQVPEETGNPFPLWITDTIEDCQTLKPTTSVRGERALRLGGPRTG